MTPDERAQLLEDIKQSNHLRDSIVQQAEADETFDIAAAWETLDELDASINDRVAASRVTSGD